MAEQQSEIQIDYGHRLHYYFTKQEVASNREKLTGHYWPITNDQFSDQFSVLPLPSHPANDRRRTKIQLFLHRYVTFFDLRELI